MGTEFTIEEESKERLIAQLSGKTWDELEVLEHAGYLLFPETLLKRKKDGSYEPTPILLRIPRPHEMRAIRVQVRKQAEKEGIDPRLDADLFSDMETFAQLAEAIRNVTEPHERWKTSAELERNYDKSCLVQMWRKVDALVHVVDPAPDTISPAEMMAVMAQIVSEKHLGPLALYGQGAQTSLVCTMAALSLNYLASKSSSGSPEASALEPFLSQESSPS